MQKNIFIKEKIITIAIPFIAFCSITLGIVTKIVDTTEEKETSEKKTIIKKSKTTASQKIKFSGCSGACAGCKLCINI